MARILGGEQRQRTKAFSELQNYYLFADKFGRPAKGNEKVTVRVTSLSLVRYRGNDYSVPTEYGHRQLWVKGYVDDVMIACGSEVIARHPRSCEREAVVFDPLHYLALLEQKTRALDQAAPLAGWQLPECFAHLRRLLEARLNKPGSRESVRVLRLLETFAFAEVTHDRVAARETVLGLEPIEDPLGCMPLLGRSPLVIVQNGVDNPYPRPKLRPPDRLLSLVAGQHSVLQHLPNRLPRQPKIPGYRTLTPALDSSRTRPYISTWNSPSVFHKRRPQGKCSRNRDSAVGYFYSGAPTADRDTESAPEPKYRSKRQDTLTQLGETIVFVQMHYH